jgi:hypothetical protein
MMALKNYEALKDSFHRTVRKFMESMPVEERLRGLEPEERLRGLKPDEILDALSPEDRERIKALIH